MKKLLLAIVIFISLSAVLYPQQHLENDTVFYPKLLSKEPIIENQLRYTNADELDSIITERMATLHIPGLTALIVKYDSVVWSRNYGYANLDWSQPVEDSTLFHMASISKTILITALMQLWEQGLFNLEDDINDYLQPDFQVQNPYYPNDTITIKMLMTHTSSIDDIWIGTLIPLISCGDSPITLEYFLANYFTPGGSYYNTNNFLNQHPADTIWHYTNVGVSILAFIVEKLSGVPFPQYCRDNIFTPLDMHLTSWFLEGLDTSDIATPYEWVGGQYVANCHQGWPAYPAAFLRTNKIELEHFLSTYMNGGVYNGYTLLNSSTIDTMLQVHKSYIPSQPLHDWGLIWFQTTLNNTKMWGHTGGWSYGTNTAMYFQPEEDWGVIVFWNMDVATSDFYNLVGVICEYADSIVLSVKKEEDIPSKYFLHQNYPNPFNPSTRIKYSVPKESDVSLIVYNMLGEKVAMLVNEYKRVGNYEVEFDAPNLASGIYLYILKAGDFAETKKMVLMK
jgi:CubicO group peptidase (beta-lactamase class C family)